MPIKSLLKRSDHSIPFHEFTEQKEKAGDTLLTVGYRRESRATSWEAINFVNCMFMRQLEPSSTDIPSSIYVFSVSVSQIHLDHVPVQPEHIENLERERLTSKLWSAFEAEPLEDGMNHPAEKIIEKALKPENQSILRWLRDLCLNDEEPDFAASVLRCLGRQVLPGTNSWRTELVRDGLATNNVEIRDASVQAAESWGGREILNVLESHSDPEPWIRDYLQNVVNDLRE